MLLAGPDAGAFLAGHRRRRRRDTGPGPTHTPMAMAHATIGFADGERTGAPPMPPVSLKPRGRER